MPDERCHLRFTLKSEDMVRQLRRAKHNKESNWVCDVGGIEFWHLGLNNWLFG